jgi:hypothetical protein
MPGCKAYYPRFPHLLRSTPKKWPKIKIGRCGLRLASRKIQGTAMRQHPYLIEQAALRLFAPPSDR